MVIGINVYTVLAVEFPVSALLQYHHSAHGSNRVGPVGAEGIAAVLAKAPTLRELHLSGNALGDLAGAALVKAAVAGRQLRGDYI